jgi:hypothetical protein
MKRIAITILATALLLLAVFTVLAKNGGENAGGDRAVQAGPTSDAVSLAATSVATATEFWRLGVTSEGEVAYSVTQGRPIHPAAAFRSNRGTSEVYYIFSAPGSQRTVQAARFHILSRTGTYAGDATLTLEILDYSGTVRHTVSAAGVDMKTAPTGAWTDITLSGSVADLEIAPGEFLAFHFSLSSTPGGDLDVRPIFEVDVTRHENYLIFLPLVLRDFTP